MLTTATAAEAHREDAAGYYRSEPDQGWAAAVFGLTSEHLYLRPAHADAASSVPLERLALLSVSGLDEVAPAQDGVMWVAVGLATGRTFEAAVPESFVDAFCAALERSAAPAPLAPGPPTPGPPATAPNQPLPIVPVGTVPVGTVPVGTVPVGAVPGATAPGHAPAGGAPAAVPLTGPYPAVVPVDDQVQDPSRRRTLAAVLVAVALFALAATSAVLWQHGSNETERADRNAALLDETRKSLRKTSASLKDTKAELEQSTQTNNELTQRVSELGNEKAVAQDERNAAREVARLGAQAAEAMLDCRNRILNALEYVADGLYASATTILDTAVPICQSANSAVAEFQEAAGS
ncbi:MAG: hypothetical protein ACKO04_14210 [Actinomycetes bacterium]